MAKAKDVAPKEQAPKEPKKVYKFKSANPFLTVAGLKVQFIGGYATTEYLEVAKALVKIDGVELVEE